MQRNRPNSDYLKYWKTVKQWAKAKYNLTNAQVELMLFLYLVLNGPDVRGLIAGSLNLV